MAIQKQNININFTGGVDDKTDPYQLSPARFLAIDNVIQTKQGLLQKRPGNAQLPVLPTSDYSYLTTFNSNLTAIGPNLAAYIEGQEDWVTSGVFQPCEVETLPLSRNAYNQISCASAICESEHLICTTYNERGGAFYCSISDYRTGQNAIVPFLLTGAFSFVEEAPKVYFFANNFCIVAPVFDSPSSNYLVLFKIPLSNLNSISTQFIDNTSFEYYSTGSFDATIAGGKLFVAWNSGSNHISYASIDSSFVQTNAANPFTGAHPAHFVNITADVTGGTPDLYIAWITNDSGSTYHTSYIASFDPVLIANFAPQVIDLSGWGNGSNVIVGAQNGKATIIFEIDDPSGVPALPTKFLVQYLCSNTGVVDPTNQVQMVLRIGLASKTVIVGGKIYFLGTFQSPYQSTYFLLQNINSDTLPTDFVGIYVNTIAKVAYGNGGGFVDTGLTEMSADSSSKLYVPYLFKDLIAAVNKDTNPPSGTQTQGVYSQTGVNLATFLLSTDQLTITEIGNNLNINGGFLWGYDGLQATEQNFFFWPESLGSSQSSGTGPANGTYFYVAVYQWLDSAGNTFQSAPSIPLTVTTSGSMTITIEVPSLTLTYKVANPAQILVFRASLTQATYYQITKVNAPTPNDTSQDLVLVSDTFLDHDITGNSILYTTGGVVEDINAPAFTAMTLFDDRLWGIDSEDQNLLWFSKQVIEATPVEMSDLFTIFIPPSTGSQGSTGVMRALAPMDDKLIIFKDNAIYYISGSGPNNTGADNGYSQPFFITGTVGCSIPRSIVPVPDGLMFQSNTGIWLLGRNLQTQYLGKDVQNYNSNKVLSSLNIPSSNIVKFNLDNGITLVYNYFFGQWTTASGIFPVSSVSYNNLTTFIDNTGKVFQETPGLYVDGTSPVLISFTTAWLNMAGLQGFERAYFFYLLATYYSPHFLNLNIAYDYDSTTAQNVLITPTNSNPGQNNIEQWRIFLQRQKCQSFQLSLSEIYNSALGVPAGAGFSMSGINVVVGVKGNYPRLTAAQQIG